MVRWLAASLDVITVLAVLVALAVLLTGGGELAFLGLDIRVRSATMPLIWAFLAAALSRRLDPARASDGFGRLGGPLRRLLERGNLSPRGLGRAHLDAFVLALVALSIFDRGLMEPLKIDGDAVGYYAWLRSPLMDRDIDFHNEYQDHDPRRQWVKQRTPIGRIENPFAVGPALLWLPFFVAGWGGALCARAAGEVVAVNGYSPPFVYATATATWLYGIAGIVLLHRLLQLRFPRPTALIATLATVFASPLAYYLPFAPHYSHLQSFFVTMLFLWCWVRTSGDSGIARWALFGLVSGLLAITRWQDAVYWVLPALTLGASALADLRREPRLATLAGSAARGLAFLGALAAALFPQLLAFRLLNGAWFTVPQGDDFIGSLPLYLWPTLFSWNHGLFTWTPWLALATLGLVIGAVRGRPWTRAFLVALLVHIYANACIAQWWAGHAFGARRFASAVPLFALGAAELLALLGGRRLLRGALLLAAVLAIVFCHVLVHQWNFGTIPHGEAIDPGAVVAQAWRDLAAVDVEALARERSLTGLLCSGVVALGAWRSWALLLAVGLYAWVRKAGAAVPARPRPAQ